MSIQYRFFVIPAKNSEESEREMNAFLRSHRTLSAHREFVSQGDNSFWSLGVEYLASEPGAGSDESLKGRKRTDYKEILSPEDFSLFVKLRDWRKAAAEKEGVPVFTVFNNDQLAEIAKNKTSSKSALVKIPGVGEGRAGKYAAEIASIVNQGDLGKIETEGTTLPRNS